MSTMMIGGLCLTGCAPGVDAKGTEGAKLLLARDRLHSEQLEGGVNFSQAAQASAVSANKRSEVELLAKRTQASLGEGLVFDSKGFAKSGDDYYWTQFPDNTQNSVNFYYSYMNNIEHFSARAAEMIDLIKDGVNQTDVWIDFGDNDYMLCVYGEKESLFCRSDSEFSIVTRYVNDEGDSVYERYVENAEVMAENEEYGRSYFLYIPNKRYEYTAGWGGLEVNRDRGYWTMSQIYRSGVQTLAMFDDISVLKSYSFDANGVKRTVDTAFAVSPDLDRDLYGISENSATVYLCNLEGLSAVKATVTESNLDWSLFLQDDQTTGDIRYSLSNGNLASLSTQSGVEISHGDTFAEGKIKYVGTNIDYTFNNGNNWSENYSGEISLEFDSSVTTYEERVEALKTFLRETGLSLKEEGFEAARTRSNEVGSILDYYTWKGVRLDSTAAQEQCKQINIASFAEYKAAYESKKDAPLIERNLFNSFSGGVKGDFASASVSGGAAAYENGKVSVQDLSLRVAQSDLLESGTEYILKLAVARRDENGWIAESEMPLSNQTAGQSVGYTSGDLTVSLTGEGLLPMGILNGEYKVVAYAATADGIRVSQLTELSFDSANGNDYALPGSTVRFALAEKSMSLIYAESIDKFIEYTATENDTAATLEKILMTEAAANGAPVAGTLETYDAQTNTGTPVDSSTAVAVGVYRVRYIATANGEDADGYIYISVNFPSGD